MKNSNRFKFGSLMILFIGFQKLVAQPQFVIQDKVVFMTASVIQDKVVFAAQPQRTQQGESGVIQDTIVFATSESSGSTPSRPIKLDSIHSRLLALKKGRYDVANSFSWFNPYPTNSMHVEGYNIVITVPNSPKSLAEIRFVRQKTNVWIDTKFSNPKNPSDIKTVVYSEANRKATVETHSGYKYSLSINAQSGKIELAPLKPQVQDLQVLPRVEMRIYKAAKLY